MATVKQTKLEKKEKVGEERKKGKDKCTFTYSKRRQSMKISLHDHHNKNIQKMTFFLKCIKYEYKEHSLPASIPQDSSFSPSNILVSWQDFVKSFTRSESILDSLTNSAFACMYERSSVYFFYFFYFFCSVFCTYNTRKYFYHLYHVIIITMV